MAFNCTNRAAWSLPFVFLAMLLSLTYAIAIIFKAVMGPDLSRCEGLDNNEIEELWLGALVHHPLAQLVFAFVISAYHIYRNHILGSFKAQLERALHEDSHGYDKLDLIQSRQRADDLTAENHRLKSYIKARPNSQVHIDLAASRGRNATITRQNIHLKTQVKQFEMEEKKRNSRAVQRLLGYLEEKAHEKDFARLEGDLTVANERIDELSYLLATLDPSGVWTDLCRAHGAREEAQTARNKLWQVSQELRTQLASRDIELEKLKVDERQSTQMYQDELAVRDREIRQLKEDVQGWKSQFELRGYKKLGLRYGDKAFMLKNRWLQAKNQYLVKELKEKTAMYHEECKSRRKWQGDWHRLVFDTTDTEDEEEG